MSFVGNNPRFDSTILTDQAAGSVGNPTAGAHKVLDRNGVLYIKASDGSETPIGSGTGSINYIKNSGGEGNTTGWTGYAAAAATPPTTAPTGSLASSNTFTSSAVTPLRGTASFLYTKGAASNTQGNGVYYAFTIDAADCNKRLSISFDALTGGTYTAADLGVYVVANPGASGTLIMPSVSSIPVIGAITNFQVFFNTTTATTYNLFVHQNSTTSNTFTLEFDNVQVGPSAAVQTVPQTDWVSDNNFVPDATAFGTVTNKQFYTKRVGDTLFVKGVWQNGTVTANAMKLAFPSYLTLDSTKLNSAESSIRSVGYAVGAVSTTGDNLFSNNRVKYLFYDGSDTATLYMSGFVTSYAFTKENANNAFTNSSVVTVEFSVPIAQWAGSSVNVSNSVVEYVSNNGTWDSDNSTSFSYGPAGQAMGGTLSSDRIKRVRFLNSIQSTDKLELEVSENGIVWYPAQSGVINGSTIITSISSTGGYSAGVNINYVSGSTTDIDIHFAQYMNMANDDSPFSNWPSTNAYWRVVKCSNPLSVGIPLTGYDFHLLQRSTAPVPQTSSSDSYTYMSGSKFVIVYNDGGTVRYKYLDMSGTGVTWVHSTSAP